MGSINKRDSTMAQFDQMFDCQLCSMAIICKDRIGVESVKKSINENIGFVCYIKSYIGFISPGFDKNDPINGTADELMNRFTLEIWVPIGTDNDAEIVMLPKIFLNTTDQDRSKRTCNVIHHKPYCEGPFCFKSACSQIRTISKLVGYGHDPFFCLWINWVFAAGERPGNCRNRTTCSFGYFT